ncbi:hypothetical protein BD770DRAFT_470987 [Pilaira anomala]|nr:hypothetical protein BD770DRAFT_470987 [Pilaira anomala]
MPGVMDIKHLLCHPCDPYSSLLEKKQDNIQINTTNIFYEPVEFWRHSRSNSTQSSISNSSCSSQSTIYHHSPSPSPVIKHRRRVNSEISSGDFIVNSPQQIYHHSRRHHRSNSSTSHIQTRTPWSPEEDGLLRKGYEQGLSWAMISCTYLPHRSRGCCWGRFKTLQSKNVMEVYQQRICQRPWKASSPKKDRKKN